MDVVDVVDVVVKLVVMVQVDKGKPLSHQYVKGCMLQNKLSNFYTIDITVTSVLRDHAIQ